MNNAIDRLFELQIKLCIEPGISAEVLVDLVAESVRDREILSLTLFTKLLDCWQNFEEQDLERLFALLQEGAASCIRSAPEAALSYFKAAQECSRFFGASYRKAA